MVIGKPLTSLGSGGGLKPQIKVTSTAGATLTCGSQTYTLGSSETSHTFTVALGTYTLTVTLSGKTRTTTQVVDEVALYEITLKAVSVWTVAIDESNSDPLACCTYADDAVGMTAGSSDWDDIFGYKPCLFVNGAVSKYLNPDNFAQDEDGNAVDITTLGNDVMIEFPKMGYKISKSGTVVTVSLTNELNNSEYCYKPFSRNDIGDKDYFYYGAYKSYASGNKLYSSSGKTPTGLKTAAEYRTYATARGTGYYQNGWYQLVFIQCLYLLKYKNLNSQSALGNGYVGGSAIQATGGANTLGMCYGNTSSQTDRLKLFGIEDFWGNIWSWVDGLITDTSLNLIITHLPVNFDNATSGTAHTSYSSGVAEIGGQYLSKVQGATDTGFIAKEGAGSESTYYCDPIYLLKTCSAAYGNRYGNGLQAGIFCLNMGNSIGTYNANFTSRLMYV